MSTPSLRISPEKALIDEKVTIRLEGAEPGAPVTIDSFIHYFGHLHLGFGHFYARSDGTVVPSEQASHGGSYTGRLDMGLFTSMHPLPTRKAGGRLLIKGSAAQILEFTLTAWKGHKTQDELHYYHSFHKAWPQPAAPTSPAPTTLQSDFLCTTVSHRTYLHQDVIRQEISADHNDTPIRGILFKPKGPGPFRGVVDMFGGAGGCLEFRAALLAKEGYAALALGYMNYKGIIHK